MIKIIILKHFSVQKLLMFNDFEEKKKFQREYNETLRLLKGGQREIVG